MKIIPVQYKAKGKGMKNDYKKVEISWIAISKKDILLSGFKFPSVNQIQ